jgi:integrase
VAAGRTPKARVTVASALDAWLEVSDIEASTRQGYRGYIERTLKPRLGHLDVSRVTVRVLEQFYAELRRCRASCDGKQSAEHTCRPMAAATVKQLHAILSGTFDAAVRWEWMAANPARSAKKPKQPRPDPQPPTAAQAASLIAAAWEQDDEWGMLVWLLMVTGVRRAELCALRRHHVDFATKVLTVRRSYLVRDGVRIEKDTKTHQRRHISLDDETVALLGEHWGHAHDVARTIGVELDDDAYLFSYAPDHSEPCNPDGVTHRYSAMARKLGIDSHPHALRHFSATELIASGVDIRTVAGRLGHGGGGTTTLRVYAAWVPESDRRAAEMLVRRFGGRPVRKGTDE